MRPFLAKIVSVTVTCLFVANSFAQTSPERWEGYRPVSGSEVRGLNLPFQGFAENAVLQVLTVSTIAPGEKYDVVEVDTIPQETNMTVLSDPKNPRALQIETCRKQNLKFCPVISQAVGQTMFFNRGRFHTCRHGFHDWISLASQLNGNRSVKEISPPMILWGNRNGRTAELYNSAQSNKPLMQFSVINDNPRLNYPTRGNTYPSRAVALPVTQSDYVEMTLSEKIVRDYAISTRTSGLDNLKLDEETYLIGYPSKTNDFPNGVGDTPGDTLVVSNGRALDPARGNASLLTTNYGSPAMSGGALVTASGELTGLYCGSNGASNPAAREAYSYPLDRGLMKQYWDYITYPTDQQLPIVDSLPDTNVEN